MKKLYIHPVTLVIISEVESLLAGESGGETDSTKAKGNIYTEASLTNSGGNSGVNGWPKNVNLWDEDE